MQVKQFLLSVFLYLSSPLCFSFLQNDFNQFINQQWCENCDLTRSVIKFKTNSNNPTTQIQIKKSYISNAKIQASDFSDSQISFSNGIRILIANSNFIRTQFNDLLLQYSLIDNVNFKDSKIINVSWNNSQFINSQFQKVFFESLSFSNTDLRFNKFIDCVFENTNFSQSDLKGVDFQGSQFKNISFKNADLRKANLYNTNITKQQLNETLSYVCAILPDGTVYDNNGKEFC
jgi:uncharacterized protein YjbI with pentapeptide repeats